MRLWMLYDQPLWSCRRRVVDAAHRSVEESLFGLAQPLGLHTLGATHLQNWKEEEHQVFAEAIREMDRDFVDIRNDFLPDRTHADLVNYYYNVWKLQLTPQAVEWYAERVEVRVWHATAKVHEPHWQGLKCPLPIDHPKTDEMPQGNSEFVTHQGNAWLVALLYCNNHVCKPHTHSQCQVHFCLQEKQRLVDAAELKEQQRAADEARRLENQAAGAKRKQVKDALAWMKGAARAPLDVGNAK